MSLNYLDIIIAVVLLFFIYRGFSNGFLQELSAIVGLIGGLFLAEKYTPQLATYLNSYISSSFSHPISFVLIIMLTLLVTSLIARILKYFFKLVFIGWLDHILGILLGFTKGALITSFVIHLITLASASSLPALSSSIFLPYYNLIINTITNFLQTNPTLLSNF